MGLDMYLTGEKYLPSSQSAPVMEDGFRVKRRDFELELGYWRKHHNLHEYIVENFAESGEDDCRDIELCAEQLEQLLAVVRMKGLPLSEYDTNDDEEKAADIYILEGALTWLQCEDAGVWKSIKYYASW